MKYTWIVTNVCKGNKTEEESEIEDENEEEEEDDGELGEVGEESEAPHWMFISDGNRITAEPDKESLGKTMTIRLRDPLMQPTILQQNFLINIKNSNPYQVDKIPNLKVKLGN